MGMRSFKIKHEDVVLKFTDEQVRAAADRIDVTPGTELNSSPPLAGGLAGLLRPCCRVKHRLEKQNGTVFSAGHLG